MTKLFAVIPALFLLVSCGRGRKTPDVSAVQVHLTVNRFEEDFFAIDTINIEASLNRISQKYPDFFGDFMGSVLALPNTDSALPAIRGFISSYRSVYQETRKQFSDFSKYQQQIEEGLKFTAYYFPKYKSPASITTFIGPMDALFVGSTASYGDVMSKNGPAIGLQLHLGKDDSHYEAGLESGIVAAYQVRRFTPETIPVNAMKGIVDDIFPYNAANRPLIEQMIEKGKRLYILDLVMPNTSDTLKIGYSKAQLDICNEHEADIWNYFVKNELVYSIDPAINQEYIEDGPKTQVLGEGVPGYLGLYTGWQIVKKWMEKNDKVTPEMLMQKNARELFIEAGYRPKG